jgi:uncharacterized membrane protein HdeD (DUF308 family)
MRPTPSDAIYTWAAGFSAAAVIQGLFPRLSAQSTAWGKNAGWQREIAIWNVGTLTAIVASRRPGTDVDRGLVTGFTVLSALFGLNHLAAGVRSPGSWGHWLAAGSNAVGVAVGLVAMAAPRDGGLAKIR